MSQTIVTAAVLVIGNEILSGRTEDRNVNFLARRLAALGVRLREVRVVPDERDTIIAALDQLRAGHTYVLTTGGIGPTHDDITTECVAAAFGVPLTRDEAVVAAFRRARPDRPMNAARLRMATFPAGAELIKNPVSVAPGYRIGNVFVLAGVPTIMQAMFESARHLLAGGAPVLSRSVSVHLAEGDIAEPLGALQARYPEIEIGSYPMMRGARFHVTAVLRGTDAEALARATAELIAALERIGGDPVEDTAVAEAPSNDPTA